MNEAPPSSASLPDAGARAPSSNGHVSADEKGCVLVIDGKSAPCLQPCTPSRPLVNPRVMHEHAYEIPHPTAYRHKFDINENEYPVSPAVGIAVARAFAEDDIRRYPHADAEHQALVTQVSAYVGCGPENVLLTCASDSALKLICDTFCTEASRVLVPVPTYPHFLSFLSLAPHASITQVQWDGHPDKMPSHSRSYYDEAGTKTVPLYDICYLCTPNMPLGYAVAKADIERWAWASPQTLFIVDEAYFEYGPSDSAAGLAAKLDNVIVTRTFSKAFGLAALRIGYLVASPHNMALLQVAHNSKSVTRLAKIAALAAITDLSWYKAQVAELVGCRTWLQSVLAGNLPAAGFIYDCKVAFGSFVSLMCRDTAYVTRIFKANGLLVRDKHADVPHAVRVTVGTRAQMAEVTQLVYTINTFKSLEGLTGKTILLDLDDTIRDGAHPGSPFFPNAATLVSGLRRRGSTVYLTTNNSCQTPAEMLIGLREAEIDIPLDRIRTPLVSAGYFLQREMKTAYVVGSPNIRQFFERWAPVGGRPPDIVIIANGFHMTLDGGLAELCRHLARGCPLYVVETPAVCSLHSCGDTCLPVDEDTRVPDLGAYVKMLEASLSVHVAGVFGKPGLDMLGGASMKIRVPWS